MTGELLQIEDRGRVRILTLNRPDQLNAFNDALYNTAIAALNAAAADPGVAVTVITGRGRAFSAGQDLRRLRIKGTFFFFPPFTVLKQSLIGQG